MNMSYCRFENTYKDLLDCQDHLWDDELSTSEHFNRIRLVKACFDILSDLSVDVDEDVIDNVVEQLQELGE